MLIWSQEVAIHFRDNTVAATTNCKFWSIDKEADGYVLLDVLDVPMQRIGTFPTIDAAKLAAEMIRG